MHNQLLRAKHCRDLFDTWNTENDVVEQEDITKVEEVVAESQAQKFNFLTPERMILDIIPVLKSNRFYALSLCGPQGTGKTVAASVFATLAMAEGYRVVYALPEDFMSDMEGWIQIILKGVTDKLCIFLDDLSYAMDMQSKKSTATVKNVISRIRHHFKGRVFLIYGTHRLHAVPPMLRNSGSWIFSSMQSADREDAMKLIARRKEMRERLDNIYTFIAKATIEGPRDGKFVFALGGKNVSFIWGTEDIVGDGRLMASFHSGDLKIFQVKKMEGMIDITSYRVKMKVPLPVDNIQKMVIPEKDEFAELAKDILPITKENDELIKANLEHLQKIKDDSYFEESDNI